MVHSSRGHNLRATQKLGEVCSTLGEEVACEIWEILYMGGQKNLACMGGAF